MGLTVNRVRFKSRFGVLFCCCGWYFTELPQDLISELPQHVYGTSAGDPAELPQALCGSSGHFSEFLMLSFAVSSQNSIYGYAIKKPVCGELEQSIAKLWQRNRDGLRLEIADI